MATGTFTIYRLDHNNWQISKSGCDQPQSEAVDISQEASIEQTAEQLTAALRKIGYIDQPVTFAIPSSWCLCASVATDGLPRKNTRGAMIYRLEDKLPIAAEEAVTDFVPGNGHSLGVCVQTDKLAPIVKSLEQHGVRIDLICPTALLALQHKMDQAGYDACNTVLWRHGQQFELFAIENKKPVTWHLLSQADDTELPIQLAMQTLTRTPPLRLTTSEIDASVRNSLAKLPDVQIVSEDNQSMSDAAATAANQIVTGKQGSWINLRRDGLAPLDLLRQIRQPLTITVSVAILFLASLCGTMLWRARVYHQIATGYENQQITLYREVFPNRPVPLNIKSRMASEQRRLAAVRGRGAALPIQQSVLLMLRDMLSCLPTKERYQIFELQIDENKIYLEGQVRSHSQAEAIAAALNKQARFKVDPPRTEKLSGEGIAFTIRGATIHAGANDELNKGKTR